MLIYECVVDGMVSGCTLSSDSKEKFRHMMDVEYKANMRILDHITSRDDRREDVMKRIMARKFS